MAYFGHFSETLIMAALWTSSRHSIGGSVRDAEWESVRPSYGHEGHFRDSHNNYSSGSHKNSRRSEPHSHRNNSHQPDPRSAYSVHSGNVSEGIDGSSRKEPPLRQPSYGGHSSRGLSSSHGSSHHIVTIYLHSVTLARALSQQS